MVFEICNIKIKYQDYSKDLDDGKTTDEMSKYSCHELVHDMIGHCGSLQTYVKFPLEY